VNYERNKKGAHFFETQCINTLLTTTLSKSCTEDRRQQNL